MTTLIAAVECPSCWYEEQIEVHLDMDYVTWVCSRCEEDVEVDGLEFGDDWPQKP